MEQDRGWKEYFSDDSRYADLINGNVCGGRQVIAEGDLREADTQTGFFRGMHLRKGALPAGRGRRRGAGQSVRIRDAVRKVIFGMNFAVIGIENQELIDYSLPLRNLSYDAGEYEKQAAKIRRHVRKNPQGLAAGEYLYGFRRDSRLYPVVTLILYSGIEDWDGPVSLHGMLDFTGMPDAFEKLVPEYRMNLIEIRKWKDTSVFQTDVRQVFDFIRCAEHKEELAKLVEQDPYYREMEEDAFDVVTCYANASELAGRKDYYRKDGKIDMCTAIREMMEESMEKGRTLGLDEGRTLGLSEGRTLGLSEGRTLGLSEGRALGIDEKTRQIIVNMLKRGMTDEDIMVIAECEQALIDEVKNCLI